MIVLKHLRAWLFWTFSIGSLPDFPSVHSLGRYYFTKEKPFPNSNNLKKE